MFVTFSGSFQFICGVTSQVVKMFLQTTALSLVISDQQIQQNTRIVHALFYPAYSPFFCDDCKPQRHRATMALGVNTNFQTITPT